MSFRLRNQRVPQRTLILNIPTWYGILELAERHGWNPMGAILSEWCEPDFAAPDGDFENPQSWEINYWEAGRLVLLEDALNLADALEGAYLDYEPMRLPSLRHYTCFNGNLELERSYIGIGTLQHAIQFCQLGAFYIEKT